jgi:DNA-binding MurR/RpiR family transcriptional regulator
MIKVSDHALFRFLERSGAADFAEVRAAIAGGLERGRSAAERAGIADYVIVADGLRYVVKDDVLVTVLGADMVAGRRRPRR